MQAPGRLPLAGPAPNLGSETQNMGTRMNTEFETYRRARIAVIATADLAALTEIVLAMRQAVNSRADLTSSFVGGFFAMFLPTVAIALAALVFLRFRYGKAIRAEARCASPQPEPDEGLF